MTMSGEKEAKGDWRSPRQAAFSAHFHASEPQLAEFGAESDHESAAGGLAAIACYDRWVSIEMRAARTNVRAALVAPFGWQNPATPRPAPRQSRHRSSDRRGILSLMVAQREGSPRIARPLGCRSTGDPSSCAFQLATTMRSYRKSDVHLRRSTPRRRPHRERRVARVPT